MNESSSALPPYPPNTYWVVPGKFLAGEYPGHKTDPTKAAGKISALLAAGVTTFIDLTEEDEGLAHYAPML